MKWEISSERNYTVDLPFPQRVNGHIIDKRYGILANVTNGKRSATVEISPFQGFLDTPLSLAIEEFKWDLEKTDIPVFNDFIEYIEYFKTLKLSPSSFFAFIQIVDQILPTESSKEEVKINQLLSFEQFIGILPAQLETVGKVKIKINRESAEEVADALMSYDIELFETFFRLDMNGLWDVQKLESLWEILVTNDLQGLIDYFEEPFGQYSQYSELQPEIPIMHEESMAEYLRAPSHALGLVYKPSQVQWPEPLPKRLVISSCWEGPYGLSALKRLATLYPQEFHGLGAHIEYPEE